MSGGMGEPRVVEGRFRLERELGRRRGAVTWLATDTASGRPCTVKELRLSEAPAAESVAIFEERGRILARLRVPGIPPFVAFSCSREGADTVCRLVQEYAPGESLAAPLAARRRAGEEDVRRWLEAAARTLAALHRQSPPLLHGNLKPANVVLGNDGAVHLVDIDLVRPLPSPPHPLWFRLPWLDNPYEAPEASAGRLTPASDVYALGSIAVAALTGRAPPRSAGPDAVPAPLRADGPASGLSRLLARMTDPDPARRPQNGEDLLLELLAMRRSPRRPKERRRRLLLWIALAVAALALLRLGIAVLAYRAIGEPPPRPAARTSAPALPTGSPRLSADREAYAPGQPITVRYSGLPGTDGDWITLVPAGAADTSYEQWFWTGSSGGGRRTFDGRPAGDYEVRVYFDWPRGGYTVRSRLPVRVVDPAAAPAPAPAGAIVEGTLLHDGRPVTALTGLAPRFWFRNEGTGKVQEASATWSDGRYRVTGLPEGEIGMSVRLDLEPGNPPVYPGDLDAWTTLRVPASGTLVHDVGLRRIIRLRSPVDNDGLTPGGDEECGRGQLLRSPVTFRWDGIGEGVAYAVSVYRMDCRRGYRSAGNAFETVTTETEVRVPLAPSPDGECYAFRLSAQRDDVPVGMFTTHGRTYLAWDLRFAVLE